MAERNDEGYVRDVGRQNTDDEATLRVMRHRFTAAEEAESAHRDLAMEDLRFMAGQQWPQIVEHARTMDNRPCLTINRLPQFLHQISNDVRQNPPSIKVSPVGDGSDPDVAEVIQGMIRHIEVDSHATVAYITAMDAAATHGRGYFRILTEYETEIGFEQCLKIRRIRNPFTVYMDPSCQEPDYSDARWGFVVEVMSKDDFRAQWPDADVSQMDQWSSTGDGWIDRDACRVAEYWYVQPKRETLALLADGTIMYKRDVPEGVVIEQERTTSIPSVYWVKTNGHEVLEREDWPGKWIPIVPVLGDEVDVDGRVQLSGIVRHAKDSQRMYNYWVSAETETIALAPRAPYVGAEGQFEGQEQKWQSANTRNWPYLEYRPRSLGGQLAPPPQRQVFEAPVQAITQARQMAADDLKATTGIYDAALGNRSNETSGRAILSRQRESDTATFHYPSNLAVAMRHAGRILLDLIPAVYDKPRVCRIIADDGEERTVTINAPCQEKGIDKLYDVTTGRYDVVVDTGPSFASKRQEAVEAMVQVGQAYPPLLQLAGDLFVRNMDWPGAREIADRLRRTVPPELLGDANEGIEPEQQVQQLQQAMQQASQQLQAMNAYAQQAEQQAQQVAQELEQLKQQMQSKMMDHQLKQQEMQLKNDLDLQRLALDSQKVELERIKLLMAAEDADEAAADNADVGQAIDMVATRLVDLERTLYQSDNGSERENE